MRKTLALAAAALLWSCSPPAYAAHVDFGTVFKDTDGAAIRECAKVTDNKCVSEIDLTLGYISIIALDRDTTGTAIDRLKRGILAMKIAEKVILDLDTKSIESIKEAIGKLPGIRAIVLYQAYLILDPASVKE